MNIILYQTADGRTSIDVKLENETVWLSKEQMAVLFERDRTVISRHIKKIYEEGELIQDITCAKFAHMGSDADQTYITELYNLDVIISVGYRVKSKRGTQFRIWANSVLKDYLIKGYAVRNDLAQQKYDDLKALVDVMGRTMGYLDSPADDQIKSIFDVVRDYTYALDTLDSYDYQTLSIRRGESRNAALPRREEPFILRREQAHRRDTLFVVHGEQPHPVLVRWS